ncbi:MAG: DUF3617 domain-containing protein [Sphingomicrobium sp.]
MRLVPLALLASATLALAACDRGPQVDLTNASPAEVAKAMKDSGATRSMVRPGKWSSTVAILEMNSPGMPPEMQAMMKQRIGQPQTVEACLTADQVDNPERMLGQIPASCRYDRYTMGSGKMDGKLRCDVNGMKQEMSVAGTYSDDQYSLIIDNKTSAPAGAVAGQPAGSMSMKMKVDSRRLGECDGTEAKPPAIPAAPAIQGNVQ